MASLTCRNRSVCATPTRRQLNAPRLSRAPLRVHAWAGNKDNWWSGLLRVFTPSAYIDKMSDWNNTGSGFSGKIDRSRKPFKDGFVKKYEPGVLAKMEEEQKQQEGEGVVEYLNNAAERVVKHNFKGDPTEPDWKETGRKGWNGDIHSRDKDGFHSKTY